MSAVVEPSKGAQPPMRTPAPASQLAVTRIITNGTTTMALPDLAAPSHRMRLRSRLARVVGRNWLLLILLLLWPGSLWAEGLALDVPAAPVHLATASADSAELTVDLADLSDSAKFPFSSTGKWTGYLEFLGKPGTERSLGQPDLFLPFLQDANDMTFLNIRGQLQFDNTDVHEYNIGLGHRHMFTDWILGGYGYFDHRNTQFNNAYRQFTGGLELMSVDWAFRMNGYLPENKTETDTSGVNISVIRPGDQINFQVDGVVQEKALPGLDGEVGYLLPIPWKAYTAVFDETRVYAGGYHFIGENQFESVTGPRGRVEWRAYDLPVLGPGSRFMMGVEAQWDEPRGSQAFGLASLRIPFDVFSDKSKRKSLKGLDRRMLQPVIRDVDIVTSEHNVPAEILPALNWQGKVITKAQDVNPGEELQDAIDENDGDVTLLVMHGDAAGVEVSENGELRDLIEVGEVTLGEDDTLTSAGKVVNLGFNSKWLGTGSIGYTPSGTPVGLNGSIIMGAGGHVNAMMVDATGHDYGILIDKEGTYLMTDNSITEADDAGIQVEGADTVAYVWGGELFRNHKSGFRGGGLYAVNGGRIEAKDVEIYENRFGARAQFGGKIELDGGRVRNNFWGLSVIGAGSELHAKNLTVSDTTGLNAVVATTSSILTLENVYVLNSAGLGVLAGRGATVTMTDSHVWGTLGGVVPGDGDGIQVINGASVTMIGGSLKNNARNGMIAVSGGKIFATGVEVSGGRRGASAQGPGEIIIRGGSVKGTTLAGLHAEASGKIFAENVEITKNTGDGVWSVGGGSEIVVKGGEISENTRYGVNSQAAEIRVCDATLKNNEIDAFTSDGGSLAIDTNSQIGSSEGNVIIGDPVDCTFP